MKNNHSGLKVLALFLFIGILCSLFFPYCRFWTENFEYAQNNIGLISSYAEPAIGGYSHTINGFGSIFGILNTLTQAVLVVGIFFFPKQAAAPITISCLFVVFLIGLWLNTTNLNKPFSDRMFEGFYIVVVLSIVNIIIAYFAAFSSYQKPLSGSLLDDLE
ncbi:MAG: hypothetical protein K0R65_2330 [Crocinitomicaceae bacterium]|jgi:hypothetical protein|nr:hypothetical protein [Crocinitomicaceae bacterium]